MEVEHAVHVLEEVRLRLASCQRFRGYSGPAAVLSGGVAVATGLVQAFEAPYPATVGTVAFYLRIWLACLAVALLVNYGTVALWYVRATRAERRQTRTAAFAILPSITLAAILSWVLLDHGLPALLPGVWYGLYGTALFSSRTLMPGRVMPVGLGFCVAGGLLLLASSTTIPMSWWVMPIGFGFGQMFIGWLLVRESARERGTA